MCCRRCICLTVAALLAGMGQPAHAGGGDKKDTDSLKIAEKLASTDTKDSVRKESYHKKHPFKMTAGKSYAIDLVSKDLDTYLRLEDAAGKEVASDDDGGGNLNARIIYKAAADGMYTIIATTYVSGAMGSYTLSAAELQPVALTLKKGEASRSESQLTDKDAGSAAGTYYKMFEVQVQAGQSLQIDLQSKAFDAHLLLRDSKGRLLAANDDVAPGNLDSRIAHKFAQAGTYRIFATSLHAAQTGPFTLTVTEK